MHRIDTQKRSPEKYQNSLKRTIKFHSIFSDLKRIKSNFLNKMLQQQREEQESQPSKSNESGRNFDVLPSDLGIGGGCRCIEDISTSDVTFHPVELVFALLVGLGLTRPG